MTAALRQEPAMAAVLTDQEITELEDGVSAGLAAAIGNLTRLREGQAHRLRGFDTWHAYVLDRFGKLLRQLHLPVDERQALVDSMDRAGMSVRETAAELAVSKSTVQNDRQELAKVHRLDDRRAQADASPAAASDGTADEQPAPAPSSVDLVVGAVARARDGYTVHEAAKRLRWRQGQASCALSRAEKRGRLQRTGRFRDGCAIYAVPTPAETAATA
ncbi:hypothetical protein QOZ88_06040 [Blastococcus sp. BMG 814]|uniref:Uncharacterized protein n=1 Tax=Blastococcus carthaginiensis TaxID=3050034 RepID=A0ABT9I9E0_9ACTN|nr:hypothetical protein [Blastococcus carthaginiensis]MDP5182191.1 hypothetical protein [Blastococcus carthaginiensis]